MKRRLRTPEKVTRYTGYVANTPEGRAILMTLRRMLRRSK